MHRHGYKGRKFHRDRDQREALIKGLAESLIRNESIETTLPKAKEVVPYIEKLITKAKKGDLHNRRQVISGLQTLSTAHKLVDEIAPKFINKTSGHLKIERTRMRRGDNAQLARVSFVDGLKTTEVAGSGHSTSSGQGSKSQEISGKAIKTKVTDEVTPAKKTPAKKLKEKKS